MALDQGHRVERRQFAAVRKELNHEYETQVGLKTQLSKDATPMKNPAFLRPDR